MKIHRLMYALMFAVIAMFGSIAQAANDTLVTSQQVDEIVAQQQHIRSDVLAAKNGWDAIPQDKRWDLMKRQDRMLALLTGKQTIGDLNESDQVEVANTLEWIKALANNAEDERQVCERERRTGSNRTTTVCRTVADIRRQRDASKDALRLREQLSRTPPPSPVGSAR